MARDKNFLILGIETTCDETSAAVVAGGGFVLSNIVSSQVELHRPYGGVVPEIAARRHIECVEEISDEALRAAGIDLEEINLFSVANGPGLAGALLVGLSYAKALAYAQKKPFVGVNHIEAHVCANFLYKNENENGGIIPPFLSLVASGGHTSLIAVRDYNTYELLGCTRDDAAGEAFDKAARTLGLPYPGGPAIDKLSRDGDPCSVKFPKAKLNDGSPLDFSFSGLKSALIQYLKKPRPENISDADVAASFQKTVVDSLVVNTLAACGLHGFKTVALAGGVAANSELRGAMKKACGENEIRLHMPEIEYCTDNGAMVACRGYYAHAAGRSDGLGLNAYPSREVGCN